MARHHDGGRQHAPQGQGAQHLEAPLAGHLVIHHKHVVDASGREGQPGVPIASDLHGVPGLLQGPLGQPRLPGVVFHDQDTDRITRGHGLHFPTGIFTIDKNSPSVRIASANCAYSTGFVMYTLHPSA